MMIDLPDSRPDVRGVWFSRYALESAVAIELPDGKQTFIPINRKEIDAVIEAIRPALNRYNTLIAETYKEEGS